MWAMTTTAPDAPDIAEKLGPPTLSARRIAGGETWSVTELVCRAGPADRPFEERHEGFSIAAVLEGSFTYRADRGANLLYPGALLLGNHRACYRCGHEHGRGDRCISFNLREDAFEEIASVASLRRRRPLSQPMLPASNRLAPLFTAIENLRDRVSRWKRWKPRRCSSLWSRPSSPRSTTDCEPRRRRQPGRSAA